MLRRFLRLAAGLCGLGMLCGTVRGDVFHLHNGGRIVGTLVEPEPDPHAEKAEASLAWEPRPWRIKTSAGAVVVLSREAVAEHVRVRPALEEYERVKPTFPDTVEGQWRLAEWCREQDLVTLRKKHLERVVELDPEHEAARRGLGHVHLDGQWAHPREVMQTRGYVEHRGRWRLPQEIDLLEDRRRRILAGCEWRSRITTWRDWILTGDKRSGLAQEGLKRLDDPAAVRVLHYLLKTERRFAARLVYCEALIRTGGPDAQAVLIERAVHDPDREIRRTCAEFLARTKPPEAAAYVNRMLRSKNSAAVANASAAALLLKDPSTLRALIDALVEMRYVNISESAMVRQNNLHGYNLDGAPPAAALPPRHVRFDKQVPRENLDALEALVAISGQNFGFDPDAWKSWYAALKKAESQALDARRD